MENKNQNEKHKKEGRGRDSGIEDRRAFADNELGGLASADN